ncbi:hypothetical protein V1503_19700 [Bacillus sp. SCS-151]|uniref:hypothetical protein n=1 Tax=Nanhaiella sioensis TaxID=3115293 RepID=UPI00397ADA84
MNNSENNIISALKSDIRDIVICESNKISILLSNQFSIKNKNLSKYGDILYYGFGSDNAIGEKSNTGHTAVLSTTDYYVIEASKTANSGNKVHHWE